MEGVTERLRAVPDTEVEAIDTDGHPRTDRFRTLMSPLKIGPVVSKNRIMRVATTANLAEGGRVGKRMRAFYRRVAEGGAGVIVSEAVRLHPSEGVVPNAVPLFDPGVIPGMRKISRSIHDNDALFIVQLNHGGRQHLGRRVGTLVSASDIPCPRSGGTPHSMTTREVEQMVEYFIAAAINARDAEADGVEIHGAQGHLIGQFLSPYSNNRDDRYGGSLENRLRFPTEILRGVRRNLGPGAVVGYRLGAEEFTKGGLSIDDTCEIASIIASEGLADYISLSQGNFNTIETHLPDRHWPIATYRDIQTRIKEAVGDLVVVQCTRIQTPAQAEDIVASGDGDMVGMCRALLVDPDWPKKAKEGRENEIRKCIACNQCWDHVVAGEPVACTVNPQAGREYMFRHDMRIDGGTVVVVGGGPAGMEAARVAADRGYRVVLFEKEDVLGGKFVHSPNFPAGGELSHVAAYLAPAIERAGVDIRLGTEATVERVLAENPHAVIVAAGAQPFAPEVPGDGSVPVIAPWRPEDMARIPDGGENIVLMDEDGYFWGAAIAEAAMAKAGKGRKLVIATRFFETFRELPMVSRIASLRALDKGGTKLLTSMTVDRIQDGRVIFKHYLSGREEFVRDVAAVLWVGRQQARSKIFDDLKKAGMDRTRLIGDAYAPRRLPIAMLEAHSTAKII